MGEDILKYIKNNKEVSVNVYYNYFYQILLVLPYNS